MITVEAPVRGPLRSYADGGVANSPQHAVFGEGSTPEAYVPLRDGRTIPVTVRAPKMQQGHTVNVRGGDIYVQGSVDPQTIAHMRAEMDTRDDNLRTEFQRNLGTLSQRNSAYYER